MALIIQEALHAIPVVEFCILLLLNLLPSYSTADGVKQGHFHEAFFIRATSLNELAVIEKVKTRSLVQCCTKCDVSYIYKGCSGVAYRDGECNIFYGTALGSFVQGNGTGDDFKVMINDAQQVQQCSSDLTYITATSGYLIGYDPSLTSFASAMDKCLSLGAHSVHINSAEEHEMIKQYIQDSGYDYRHVWTGGRTEVPGSTEMAHWRWYYPNDLNGLSDPFTYIAWDTGQPNNLYLNGYQYIINLDIAKNSNFNDYWLTNEAGLRICFLCECP